jgi:hypothetical protein
VLGYGPPRRVSERRNTEISQLTTLQMRGTLDEVFRLFVKPKAEPLSARERLGVWLPVSRAHHATSCIIDVKCTYNVRHFVDPFKATRRATLVAGTRIAFDRTTEALRQLRK